MRLKAKHLTLLLSLLPFLCRSQTREKGDALLGKWNGKEKTITIEFYQQGEEYRAKLLSFIDHHNPAPIAERTDIHNPDRTKRSRKIIGMDVITGLHFDPSTIRWTDGKIYDVGSGSTYSAFIVIEGNVLSIRAFKGFSLIGKTMHFSR